MDRAFESGAVVLAPAVPAVPSVGFPTGGNPVGGVPATKPGAHWFHMITEELRAVIVAGGLTPDPAVVNQVLQALPLALASRPEMARSLSSIGYQKFPGGLVLQWGTVIPVAFTATTITFPIAFPSAFFAVAFCPVGSAGSSSSVWRIGTPTTVSMQLASEVGGNTVFWMAIGI